MTADAQGNVFFSDSPSELIYKIAVDGTVSVFEKHSGGARSLMVGPDGRLYAAQNERLVSYSTDGKEKIVADHMTATGMAFNSRGGMYVTDARNKRVWLIDQKGGRRVVHEGIASPNGILLSTGEKFLTVSDSDNRGIWWFQVQPDGSLANGDAIYRLEVPDESTVTGAGGMVLDSEGFLYVATNLGIQVFDPPGRVMAILGPPQAGSVVFGGPRRDILYVTAGDKVFRRAMKHAGAATPRPKP